MLLHLLRPDSKLIGIFAVSTFNTDYILVKDVDFEKSLAVLLNAGYTVI